MSLFHVDYHRKVKPLSAEENEFVQLFRKRVHPSVWLKVLDIFDERIQELSPSQKSALTFAMLASLMGYQREDADSQYVWQHVWKAARGHQKVANYMLGCLAMWRFTLDDRSWIAAKKPTDRLNAEGEEMAVTIYWVAPL